MPTSPEHQPEDQSLLDTDILSELGESIDPLVVRNASVQSGLAQLAQKEFVLAPYSASFLAKSWENCSETTPKVDVVKI
jgi:hypothetical protein